jgi:hypothetical protein
LFDRRPRTKAVSRDAIAAAETELAALPADIAAEFPLEQGGALEIAQLRQQFDALFDGNNDGTISAGELLGAASLIGDTMDPKVTTKKHKHPKPHKHHGSKDAFPSLTPRHKYIIDRHRHHPPHHHILSVSTRRGRRP